MRTHLERLAISVHGFLLSLGCPGVEPRHLQGTHLSLWLSCLSPPSCLHGTGQQMHFLAEFLDPPLWTPRQTPVGQRSAERRPFSLTSCSPAAWLGCHRWGALKSSCPGLSLLITEGCCVTRDLPLTCALPCSLRTGFHIFWGQEAWPGGSHHEGSCMAGGCKASGPSPTTRCMAESIPRRVTRSLGVPWPRQRPYPICSRVWILAGFWPPALVPRSEPASPVSLRNWTPLPPCPSSGSWAADLGRMVSAGQSRERTGAAVP